VLYRAGRRTALAAGARAQHLAQLPAQLPAQLRGQVAGGRAARGRGLVDEAQELGLVAVDQRQQLRVLLAQLLRAGCRVGLHSTCPAPAPQRPPRRQLRRRISWRPPNDGTAAGDMITPSCRTACLRRLQHSRQGWDEARTLRAGQREAQASSERNAGVPGSAGPLAPGLRSHARCRTHQPVDRKQAAPACDAGDPQAWRLSGARAPAAWAAGWPGATARSPAAPGTAGWCAGSRAARPARRRPPRRPAAPGRPLSPHQGMSGRLTRTAARF